jgi:large subunit ribosomal protein L31
MKKEIHPKYYDKAKVTCTCGATFEIGATVPEMKIEICSACHPAYTGVKKFMDTAGRLDRFKTRLEKSQKMQAEAQQRAKTKKTRREGTDEAKPSEEKPPTTGDVEKKKENSNGKQ